MLIKLIFPSFDKGANTIQSNHHWYEHWMYVELKNEFVKRGHEIATHVDQKVDVDLLCGGIGGQYKHWLTAPKRYWWIFNHIDRAIIEPELIDSCDHVWLGSHSFYQDFKTLYPRSSVLTYATAKKLTPRTKTPEYDIVFNGNAKGNRRELMQKLVDTNKYKILLCGHGWQGQGGVDFVGEYWPYEKLADFYNQGWVTWFSGHSIDKQRGFTYARHLDVCACSECLIITEWYEEWRFIFQHGIPSFSTSDGLVKSIDYFLADKNNLKANTDLLRKDVENMTYCNLVDKMEVAFT